MVQIVKIGRLSTSAGHYWHARECLNSLIVISGEALSIVQFKYDPTKSHSEHLLKTFS